MKISCVLFTFFLASAVEARTDAERAEQRQEMLRTGDQSHRGLEEDGNDGTEDDGDDAVCYSGNMMVNVQGQGPTTMDNLKLGDYVQDGPSSYSKVFTFDRNDSTVESTFTSLKFNSGDLELSAPHMVQASGSFIPSADVQVGDVLSNGESVDSVESVKRSGAYAPITESGTVLVNGVQGSSYVINRAPKIIGMSLHDSAHFVYGPLRLACKTVMDCTSESYNEAGASSANIVFKTIRDTAESNAFLSAFGWSIAFALMGAVSIIEAPMLAIAMVVAFAAALYNKTRGSKAKQL